MLRKSTHAARRLGRTLSLALALGAGTAVVMSTPAAAQNRNAPKAPTNSKGFDKAFTPFKALVDAGDMAGAKAMVPAVVATIEVPHDKTVMGSTLVKVGDALQDKALQKQGVTLLIEGGEMPPETIADFNYYRGNWAFDDKDYAASRQYYQAAIAGGTTQPDSDARIAETYIAEGNTAEGLRHLSDAIAKLQAAGTPVPTAWYQRGLGVAYDAKLAAQANQFARGLVGSEGTNQNWYEALNIMTALNQYDDQTMLDLLRLMRLTDTIRDKYNYQYYLDIASRVGLPSETLSVLKYGVDKGAFTATDPLYTNFSETATPLAARDLRDAPNLAKDAEAAATGRNANGAGNAFYNFGQYAEAEAMYKLALEKGGVDADTVRTRLGMSQIQQEKFAEGQATLGQVNGTRVPVAAMWIAYAKERAASGG